MNLQKVLIFLLIFGVVSFFAFTSDAVKKEKRSDDENVKASESAVERPTLPLTVAVYSVSTNGFSLNGSEVTEINRLVLQACYDAGFKCSARDQTVYNVQKEQSYGGRGKISQANYIAEFTLTGMTGDSLKLGIPGGVNVGGIYGHKIGGVVLGGGGYTDLSGLGLRLSKMSLTAQITDSSDGTLAYSNTREKMGLTGSFLVGEGTSSNAKKLLASLKDMFEDFRKRIGK